MGSIFGSTSYQETEADRALREDIERKRKEEADEVAKQEANRVKQKKIRKRIDWSKIFV